MNLRRLRDPELAWRELSSDVLPGALQTEVYAEIAFEDWRLARHFPDPTNADRVLGNVASALLKNHRDRWLSDFLSAPSSPQADRLLLSAIEANRRGDIDSASHAAMRANRLYLRSGNLAGALRSRWENIYSLRRQSRASSCLAESSSLLHALKNKSYAWLNIQTLLENSSCDLMSDDLDLSRDHLALAREQAVIANYPNLDLRAIGLKGDLESLEGRFEDAWQTSADGLRLFWRDTYSNDRGFQLYHNLQVDAETGSTPYLNFLLHQETTRMIAEGPRLDFTAMARVELAAAAEAVGDYETAKTELDRANALFCRPAANFIP